MRLIVVGFLSQFAVHLSKNSAHSNLWIKNKVAIFYLISLNKKITIIYKLTYIQLQVSTAIQYNVFTNFASFSKE